MKLNLIIGTILFINFCDLTSSTTLDDEVDKVAELCKTQEGATDNDMVMWKDDVKPKPRVVKCLDACVGEKTGMLVNNRLNVNVTLNVITMDETDPKTISAFRAVINECETLTDADRCEAVSKILDCIRLGSRQRGIKEIF